MRFCYYNFKTGKGCIGMKKQVERGKVDDIIQGWLMKRMTSLER